MYQELLFFCRTFLAGVFLAVCYDVLRIIRKIIVHTSFWMGMEDIFYWCFTGVFLFFVIYTENNGVIRSYALLAMDVTTQAQIVRQFMEIRDLYHTAIIMVTHNIAMAAYMADQLIVMRNGRITESGKKEDVIKNPKSEYTKNLLACVPDIGGKRYV